MSSVSHANKRCEYSNKYLLSVFSPKEDGNLRKPSYEVGQHPCLLSQPELTWHGDSTYGGTKPGWGWGTISRRNRHAKLAPAGSINMGASPLRNLASLSYHPLSCESSFKIFILFSTLSVSSIENDFWNTSTFSPLKRFCPQEQIAFQCTLPPDSKCKWTTWIQFLQPILHEMC